MLSTLLWLTIGFVPLDVTSLETHIGDVSKSIVFSRTHNAHDLYELSLSRGAETLSCMEGRFQLPDQAKFNRPDPMRDWNWLQPHTINLYEYVGNDPINSWDPSGLYVVREPELTGDVDKDEKILKQHQQRIEAFEASRAVNLERGGEVEKAVASYGGLGEENGVVVAFASPSDPEADGAVEEYSIETTIDNDGNLKARLDYALVNIDPSVFSDRGKLEAVSGHEGAHLRQRQTFASSISFDFPEGDPSLNITHGQAETEAFLVTDRILDLWNGPPQSYRARGGTVKLGKGISGNKLLNNIGKIIDGPSYRAKKDLPLFKNFPSSNLSGQQ